MNLDELSRLFRMILCQELCILERRHKLCTIKSMEVAGIPTFPETMVVSPLCIIPILTSMDQ